MSHFYCKNTNINVKPAGGGGVRAWGGDLIVFVGPGVGHLTDLVLPGEGIFESFFASLGIFDSDVQPGVGKFGCI